MADARVVKQGIETGREGEDLVDGRTNRGNVVIVHIDESDVAGRRFLYG